jgi:Zn-dependent metalloprotease
MHACRNPLHCFVPPYILDHLAENAPLPEVQEKSEETLEATETALAQRAFFSEQPGLQAFGLPSTGRLNRRIYNMWMQQFPTPGLLVRAEGDPPSTDPAVNEAYDYSGTTYEFYDQIFNRNSLDGQGLPLISSVHFGFALNNAFWNGQQMQYGDGDGFAFQRFTRSLKVVGHELTHGVIQYESNLVYQDQPGALNEHFADVMGALIEQWHKKQDVTEADWFIGGEVLMPQVNARGIRTFLAEKAYENNPYLGTDPQPKNMRDLFTGTKDNGGVHINSGIPNHAFYRVAMELGGQAWVKAGRIWYTTMRNLSVTSDFQVAANMSYQVAGAEFGAGSLEQQAVRKGWQAVGIEVPNGEVVRKPSRAGQTAGPAPRREETGKTEPARSRRGSPAGPATPQKGRAENRSTRP